MEILFNIISLILILSLSVIFMINPMLQYMKPGSIFLRCTDCRTRGTMKKIREPDIINQKSSGILDDETERNDYYIYQCFLCKKEVKV
jgi:hypothetical protein